MPAKGVETEEGTIKASLAFLENLLGDYRPRATGARGGAFAGDAPLEGARPAGRHLPLRRTWRVLRAVAGRTDGLLLRVLRHARGGSGQCPGAQELDYICRKLRLRPGERLLDIGCGWGGLIIHAAHRYGVRARGITLGEPQAELADSCRVEVSDYREIEDPYGYDKLVSVGMFERVGEARLSEYFLRAHRLLRPGGVFLNHGISRNHITPVRRGPTFMSRYVFPDGELVPIATTIGAAEGRGFEVRDVESLREHYALTLGHWVRRLEARSVEARRITDETTYRAWRLYMSGSAHGFRTGRLNVCQTLLSKPERGESRLPLTRADWYA